MFLAVNHATCTLTCDNLMLILHLCGGGEPTSFSSGSVYVLQPRYRLQTWSKSTMSADRLNGLALAYVHDITQELLQMLQKCIGSPLVTARP